jgi:uncharacterized protein YbgA (DUF1722 family)/uncharacterized protein YbbK (DUF523 family)
MLNTEKLTLGISACLVGNKVRFDGSSKTSKFCVEQLNEHVEFQSFCPEVAIGLPIPRRTIRQIKDEQLIKVSQSNGEGDITDALKGYGERIAKNTKHLSGFIFCAKSPSCGMERVKVYSPEGNSLTADGVGVFAEQIMLNNPQLPCEENGRLNDPLIRENFIARVFAYKHWQQLVEKGLSQHELIKFHSQYKYTLMSHDLVLYKRLGRLVANAELTIEQKESLYIVDFMSALKKIATRKKHANTLSHLLGYFSKKISRVEKQELVNYIDQYRLGLVPLVAPLTLLKHHLLNNPKDYLANQRYFAPYPENLKLRYAL